MDKLGYSDEGLKSRLIGLTDNQKYQLLKMLQQELGSFQEVQKSGVESLYGNKEAILNELKEKHIDIEENVEMVGYKGKKVHINLPAVGNFEGFKFDYFVSEVSVRKSEFEKRPELIENSYSMKEVGELLQAMDEYMKELGVEMCNVASLENHYKYWIKEDFKFGAGDCLKKLTGLNKGYWLIDKNVAGKDSRVTLDCSYDVCSFDSFIRDYNRNYLFLKLSDQA